MPARKCPYCAVVSNFGLGAVIPGPSDGEYVLSLDSCNNCGKFVYYESFFKQRDVVKDQYPKDTERAPDELPESIRKAFDEALVCQRAEAPNGALLMCRRALQETMNEKGAKKGDLPVQLDDLVEKQEITPKLRDWAAQAQIGGRIAAHGTGGEKWGDPDKVWGTMDDAGVVIDYLRGFFEYVYVLGARMKAELEKHKLPASSEEPNNKAK